MIYTCNYEPTVWIRKFIIADYEKEAGYPMSYKSNQYDKLDEFYDDIHGLWCYILFKSYENTVQPQNSQQSKDSYEAHDFQES